MPIFLAILIPVVIGGITYLVQKLVQVSIDEIDGASKGDPVVIARLKKRAEIEHCAEFGMIPSSEFPGTCIPEEWACPDGYIYGGLDENGNPRCYPPPQQIIVQTTPPNLVQPPPPPPPPAPPPAPKADPKIACFNNYIAMGYSVTEAMNLCGYGKEGSMARPPRTVKKEEPQETGPSNVVFDTRGAPFIKTYDTRGAVHYEPIQDDNERIRLNSLSNEDLLKEMKQTIDHLQGRSQIF